LISTNCFSGPKKSEVYAAFALGVFSTSAYHHDRVGARVVAFGRVNPRFFPVSNTCVVHQEKEITDPKEAQQHLERPPPES
jgi:hypothetical protein